MKLKAILVVALMFVTVAVSTGCHANAGTKNHEATIDVGK